MSRFLKQRTFLSLIVLCSVALLLLGAAYVLTQAQLQRDIEVEVDKAVGQPAQGQLPQPLQDPLRERATLLSYITQREQLLQQRAQEVPDERAVATIYFKNRTIPLTRMKQVLQNHQIELSDLQFVEAMWEEYNAFVLMGEFIPFMDGQGIVKNLDGFSPFWEEQERSLIRQSIQANQDAIADMMKQPLDAATKAERVRALGQLLSRNRAYHASLEENGLHPISARLETTYSGLKELSNEPDVQFVNLVEAGGRAMSGQAFHAVLNQ